MKDINNQNINNDEIDLLEVIQVLFNGKILISFIVIFFSIIGIIYSLSLPNIYQSKALLVSSAETNSSDVSQNFSALSRIASIDLGSTASDSNAIQAIEKIQSLSFFENSILPNIFLADLMAIDSWNRKANKLIYDNEIYDISKNIWVRDFSFPKQLVPSAQESYEVFRQHLDIEIDTQTNFLSIKINHQSPYIAKIWLELLVIEINSFYRKKDKSESEIASNYLKEILAKSNLSEIKQITATLLQQETQKLALIEAKEFYVFEYIDPPAVMEKKSDPNRAIICILFSVFGIVAGMICVLARHYSSSKPSTKI